MADQPTRREFLTGHGAGRALSETARRAVSEGGSADSHGARWAEGGPTGCSYVVHVSRAAMAGEFQVFLNAGQYDEGMERALEALDLVGELEARLSVFQSDSEITTINREAADRPVEVEPRLFELLKLAGRIHEATGGAFDLTAGPLWEAWGFARREGRVPSDAQLADVLKRTGWHHVELDERAGTIRFKRRGVGLNLGSIGKGYAVDRCREVLAEGGVDDFLIHGGKSSVLAQGRRLSAAGIESGGWDVGIRHPLRPDRRLAEIRLRDRALATSGSGVQFFRHQGRRLGHVLDPRTGQPAEGVLSVTVLAPTAAEADALATALYVLGVDGGLDFCRSREDLAAVYVLPARRAGGMEVVRFGLDDAEWRPLAVRDDA